MTGGVPGTTDASRRRVAIALLAGLLGAMTPAAAPLAQSADRFGADRLGGLTWTFVRIKYRSEARRLEQFRRTYWSDPWAIDAPAAEQNLSRRMVRVTSVIVNEPITLELTDDALWEHPWIYFVEPSNLELSENEAGTLREFLLRGGTATFDDFHGPLEFDLWTRQVKRVFPDREIVRLEPDHPIFSCFYELTAYPQIPGLGSFFSGVTWEKGGYEPQLHAVLADDGRAMILANFNTDMGDGWEWSNAEEYPGYIKFTAQSYRMIINEIVYALTH